MGSNQFYQFYIKNQCFEPIYKPIKVAVDIFTLQNSKKFDPHEGLEGHSCPGINILGTIYNIDAPFCTSD